MDKDKEKKEIMKALRKNIESVLAITIKATEKMPTNNMAINNGIQVGDKKYRYSLVIGKEGSKVYEQLEEEKRNLKQIKQKQKNNVN